MKISLVIIAFLFHTSFADFCDCPSANLNVPLSSGYNTMSITYELDVFCYLYHLPYLVIQKLVVYIKKLMMEAVSPDG